MSDEEVNILNNKLSDTAEVGIFKKSDYNLDLNKRRANFEKFNYILCESCNQEIESSNFICYNCYNTKEIDNNERYRMNYGICEVCSKPNTPLGCCKIFRTSDYDLNLSERIMKYENFNYIHIFCEKCNQEINKEDYYCYDCYDKETDNNKQNWMKYGGKFVIFKTSDYDLNLKERKEKYKDYDHFHCEECNQEIGKYYYYCYDCYNKKTDNNEKNWMKYGRKVRTFKASDYDLNLKERKEKYLDYDHILCEECNQEIVKYDYYCYDCYNKKTDNNEKNWMKYGRKVRTFKASDYDLNLKERKEKYLNYDHILCEECNQKIGKYYYCHDCYNMKTDNNEKNWMKYGRKVRTFKTSDYDLNLKERKEKYMDYNYYIHCEKCNQRINAKVFYCANCYDKETDNNEKNWMKYGRKIRTFKTSDYDLNLEERKEKYLNYDHILCDKCNQSINIKVFYCTNCYNKKTDNNEKNWMKYGICKVCFKSLSTAFGWCSSCKIEGPKVKIFKTSDYNLNLEEKKKKYSDYDHILCEECNQEISKDGYNYYSYYYCYGCYNKKTDNNEKNWMKYGIRKVCFKSLDNAFVSCDCCKIEEPRVKNFKTSDYDLNLKERKEKYKDYDHVLCEECDKEINIWNYYCIDCYDYNVKIDNNERNWMKYGICKVCFKSLNNAFGWCSFCKIEGPKVKIFKTSDYDLNLKERKEKYKDYNYILCEECDKEINIWNYYCIDCYYNVKIDNNERNWMKYGICKVCFKSLDNAFGWCSSCKIEGPKVKIFKTSDYNLNFIEREEKYKDFDHILCEECNQKINKKSYCCDGCYEKKEDNNERNWTYGKCKICPNSNPDKYIDCCSTYELKQFLKDFDKWFYECEINVNVPKPKVGISDHDLDEDDRQVKYKNYDYILCEKCNKKFHYYYCYDCYDKKTKELEELQFKLQDYKNFYSRLYNEETKELKELKELQYILKDYENVYFNLNYVPGMFQQIIQTFENTRTQIKNGKTQMKNIRYNGTCECFHEFHSYCYDCYNMETDSSEKERIELGRCKECFHINDESLDDCSFCRPKRIQRNFDRWSSGNKIINKLIQDNQLSAKRYELLEWIPYDKFTDVKHIADGGFAKVYSATWIVGQIKKWSQLSNNWKRSGPLTVALKVLNNSENITEDFLNEIKFFNKVNGYMCVIECFGITQDPNTHNYALVLQYMESGDLRSYLKRTVNSLTWQRRLDNMYDICLALKNIHIHKLMHKDLHPGNIFIDSTFAYIGDFGFCIPANENLSNSTKNVYGVMPYMAPEILRGKPYTLASDVYSLGVIINEIITVNPPFNNQPHDHFLALDICRGLRPNIRIETPDSLRELIEKCWDANPKKRPTSEELLFTLSNNLDEYKNMPFKKLSFNFNNESTNITSLLDKKMQLKTHPQASYTSQLCNFQNLPEPMNCPNQQEFIFSRNIQSGIVIRSNESLESYMIMDID